jgi:hypothetical protein
MPEPRNPSQSRTPSKPLPSEKEWAKSASRSPDDFPEGEAANTDQGSGARRGESSGRKPKPAG